MSAYQRVRDYAVTPYLLAETFREGWSGDGWRVAEGVPASAKLVGWYVEDAKRVMVLRFEDESFPIVPPGEIVPRGMVIMFVSESKQVPRP